MASLSDNVRRVQDWLRAHEDDLLRDTVAMLQIPSLESDAGPNAPFGPENRRALDLALKMSEEYGFSTADLEGYCGWAEVGNGKPMVMSLGHLDVVPVGPGWKHQPFGAEIDGGYVYARGAVDDKGPTMASFYAIRAIKECVPDLDVRLRIVFGCNEESGFKCVERYAKTEEMPTLGVAPDSGWPLYHAEKGICNFVIAIPIDKQPVADFVVTHLDGGQRPNIVIDALTARVRIGSSIRSEVEGKCAEYWDRNVSFAWEGDTLTIEARGKAAHGAAPFLGDSAATRVFRALLALAPLGADRYWEAVLESTQTSGVGLGIHGRDDASGDLTNNLGIVRTENGAFQLTFNVRRPVTWDASEVPNRLNKFVPEMGIGATVASFNASEPLYFPLDHPLVKTIVDVYEAETGERKAPGVMGGGTYARAIPNTVSIGTGWDGDGPAHETDEKLKIEHLFKMSRIYAHLFLRLIEEAKKLA